MNLAPLAKQILLENEMAVEDMAKEFQLSERGYEFLKTKLEKLNKKTAKWGVAPIELKVNRVEERDVSGAGIFGDIKKFKKKYYWVTLIGDPPQVEGFTFIGKVQHTPGGENILNIAPNSPVKNLPEIFRTIKGTCDVCKQNRERFNTFVLRMDNDSDERFPGKKKDDLIQVGSACLKRFLPDLSVKKFMDYASVIEMIRNMRGGDDDYDEYEDYMRSGPNAFRGHMNTEALMLYIALVYSVRGKYVPKSKASYDNPSTAEEALGALMDRDDSTYVSQQVKANKVLVDQAKTMAAKVTHWMKKHDFNEDGKKKPEFATYFGNLNVVAHAPTVNVKNMGYLGGVLQSYLYYEKQKAQAPVGNKAYVGKIGERIMFNGLLKKQKAFPNQWGPGTVHLYSFEDLDGNNIVWWASKNMNFIEGQRYPISAIIKKHEIDKWSNQPTTTVKNGKLEKD